MHFLWTRLGYRLPSTQYISTQDTVLLNHLTRFLFSSIKNITCLNLPCGATSVQYEPPCSFFHKIKSPCRRLLVLEALKSGREANLYRKRNPGLLFFPPGLSCSLCLQHLSTIVAIYENDYKICSGCTNCYLCSVFCIFSKISDPNNNEMMDSKHIFHENRLRTRQLPAFHLAIPTSQR